MKHADAEVIVFDAVGTLIYPHPPVGEAYHAAGRRFGSQRSLAEVERQFRDVFAEMEARDRAGELRTSEAGERARWQTIVGRVLDDVNDPAACFDALFEHFARPSAWRVFPDVPGSFARLIAAGVELAIASNFDDRLRAIAAGLEPLGRCRHVLVSSRIGYRKPHPAFFRTVVETVGTPADRIVYVGDDPANDVAGARSVGMKVLHVDRARRHAPAELSSLDELPVKLGLV